MRINGVVVMLVGNVKKNLTVRGSNVIDNQIQSWLLLLFNYRQNFSVSLYTKGGTERFSP